MNRVRIAQRGSNDASGGPVAPPEGGTPNYSNSQWCAIRLKTANATLPTIETEKTSSPTTNVLRQNPSMIQPLHQGFHERDHNYETVLRNSAFGGNSDFQHFAPVVHFAGVGGSRS
jgi:hypothetical protein